LELTCHLIGPRQPWEDFTGDWARAREIGDSGVLLVRPDQHVAWRRESIAADPVSELRTALTTILGR
jgi:2,4-dichlorophenol 6-monooxygenase